VWLRKFVVQLLLVEHDAVGLGVARQHQQMDAHACPQTDGGHWQPCGGVVLVRKCRQHCQSPATF
jgi:hypothetical protein